MYRDYYLQVRDVADKIRSNPTNKVTPEREGEGFIPLKKTEPTEPQETTMEDMILSYMQGVRQSSPTAQHTERMSGFEYEGSELERAREALGQIESSNNYQAKGPTVTKGQYKGQRAIGKYQVMEGNVGPWTEEILGVRMTPEQFLQNPQAQDMVAEYRLAESKQKHGSWDDAASVWFSGRPMKKAGNASDGYNTVPQYVSKFRKAFG